MAHTPGPWYRKHKGYGHWRVVAGQKVIADSIGDHEELNSGESNARIIAAGPTMLAALEAIFADGSCDDDGDFILYRQDEGEEPQALVQARAAIRQARGE